MRPLGPKSVPRSQCWPILETCAARNSGGRSRLQRAEANAPPPSWPNRMSPASVQQMSQQQGRAPSHHLSLSLHLQQQRRHQQQQQQPSQKLAKPSRQAERKMALPAETSAASQTLQRKLFALLYLYAILIVSLYLTYAAYYFLQQHLQQQLRRNQQDQWPSEQAAELRAERGAGRPPASGEPSQPSQQQQELESKLEQKVHLLERYIELIALDLQETKNRVREREKCHCSIGCTFNGTKYADSSSWRNQCDTCTCQVSSAPLPPPASLALACKGAPKLTSNPTLNSPVGPNLVSAPKVRPTSL